MLHRDRSGAKLKLLRFFNDTAVQMSVLMQMKMQKHTSRNYSLFISFVDKAGFAQNSLLILAWYSWHQNCMNVSLVFCFYRGALNFLYKDRTCTGVESFPVTFSLLIKYFAFHLHKIILYWWQKIGVSKELSIIEAKESKLFLP